MKKTSFLFLFVNMIFVTTLFSAAPITHYFLAKQWLEKHSELGYDENAFLLGTLIPDVVKFENAPREKTHKKNVSLNDILKKQDAFEAGFLFHSYVDNMREIFALKWGIYKKFRGVPKKYRALLLKLIEDEIFASRNDYSTICVDLQSIDAKERQYASLNSLEKYHTYLIRYFSCGSPSEFIDELQQLNEPFWSIPASRLHIGKKMITSYAENSLFKAYVDDLIKYFELLFNGDL